MKSFFTLVKGEQPANQKIMHDGKYIWRNWYPRTQRQVVVSDVAYVILSRQEPHAESIIIEGAEYNSTSGLWRIKYALKFAALPKLVIDDLFLHWTRVNEVVEEEVQ